MALFVLHLVPHLVFCCPSGTATVFDLLRLPLLDIDPPDEFVLSISGLDWVWGVKVYLEYLSPENRDQVQGVEDFRVFGGLGFGCIGSESMVLGSVGSMEIEHVSRLVLCLRGLCF